MNVKNIVVISDTHSGCQLGLCPPTVTLDSGGTYSQSALQAKTWGMWGEFWEQWVPLVTKGEDFVLVHNGDVIDGVHHNSVTQISQNLTVQRGIARQLLEPIIKNPKCVKYFQIRGTEAHVGKSGQDEEELAKDLGAEPDELGNYARWELWLRVDKRLVHFTHHVGTTSSSSYESTAVHKELVDCYTEAGRWNNEPPDAVVRSHRHRQFEIKVANEKGYGFSIVTPGWQLKTPFAYRIALGRSSMPQIGGYLLRSGSEDHLYTRCKVWTIQRSKEVPI